MTTLFALFFFNDTATTEIYTLSLHDALPIYDPAPCRGRFPRRGTRSRRLRPLRQTDRARRLHLPAPRRLDACRARARSEEHTSELQSRLHLVCRLLLEKKKTTSADPQPSLMR